MAKLSEYVMVAEAAEILGVSQGTVRAWAEAGKIPVHRNPANGYRLFRRKDLNRFLAKVAKPEKKKKWTCGASGLLIHFESRAAVTLWRFYEPRFDSPMSKPRLGASAERPVRRASSASSDWCH
ncbi:MAG: hypothetical protein KatS3mg082_1994 [Nitrospiraceae bacterium]|nr:MAG: hypothetical protein KatS3mg082_1994 [Nitrospiraceae bacterium]